MADAALRGHQALTRAHVEGRDPVIEETPAEMTGTITYFTPQSGERVLEWTGGMRASEGSLQELAMYWQRIPDFAIERYRIYPSETGWVQVVYWGGTSEDGEHHRAEEVDVVDTDDDFNVVRYEVFSDKAQWMNLVAYAYDRPVEELGNYGDMIAETEA